MKKLVLMACVMSAMIFASCGSKEYKEAKSAMKDYESAIENAKDCPALEKAITDYEAKVGELLKQDYKNDTCSKEENDELDKLEKEIYKKAEDKAKELKCD